jgi:glycosyltransferase involved in cell wall biosynthesis
MDILHTVEFYHPSRGGAQEVVRQLSERLVKRGHRVTVATTRLPDRQAAEWNGVRIEEFGIRGNAVTGIAGEAERYQGFLRRARFDVMLTYAAQQWASDLAFPLLREISAVKVFVPCGYSALHAPAYREYFSRLPAILREYDQIVYLSARYRDAEFGRQHGLTRWTVIPNAAAEEEFLAPPTDVRHRYGIGSRFVLLCVANHYPDKGHDAVIQAFRRARIRDALLLIVGERPPSSPGCLRRCRWTARCHNLFASRTKRVRLLTGLPRPDVVSAFQEADLFVFGSRVECSPLVIFEAMAGQAPFVSTDCGNVRELADQTGAGVAVAGVAEMANAIEALWADPARRREMGRRGAEAWRARYTWEHVADQYERLYRRLLAARPPGSAHR